MAEKRPDTEYGWLELAGLALARFRPLVAAGFLGAAFAAFSSLTSPRQYVSTASFVPTGGTGGESGLAAAAQAFGIGFGDAGAGMWAPGLYVQVLQSNGLLMSLAGDTVVVAEEGGRRVALVDLFRVARGPAQWRQEKLLIDLRAKIIGVNESRLIGTVNIRVSTKWPSVSEAIATALVQRVNDFNLQALQQQAAAELKFFAEQGSEADSGLRRAEDALAAFLRRNRMINAAELEFERDRLARAVRFHEQMALTLAERREDARLRRIQDTPAITLVESPRRPVLGEPRGTIFRTILGGLAGGGLAIAWILLAQALDRARVRRPVEYEELYQRLRGLLPAFLRSWLDRTGLRGTASA